MAYRERTAKPFTDRTDALERMSAPDRLARARLVVGAVLVAACLHGASAHALFSVGVESGTRATVTGDRLDYTLFRPLPAPGLPPPPYPAVVLTHGFARNRAFHRDNAQYMGARGFVVLTPDMSTLLRGATDQQRNIANTVDHMHWLAQRAGTPGDALFGLLDPARIGLAGHSAGGAVSFEAAMRSVNGSVHAAALCLLDGVPWSRTVAKADGFPVIPFCAPRSEPSACNRYGDVLRLLERLPFVTTDIRIVGGTHCDPENPTDALCGLACGDADSERQAVYQALMARFFEEALRGPLPEPPGRAFAEWLDAYEAAGAVVPYETDLPPLLVFDAPADGALWPRGSTQTLRWTAYGIAGRVTLSISCDGRRFRPFARAIPNTGRYTITLGTHPPIPRPCTTVRVAVTTLGSPRLSAVSGAVSVP
jgi:dienelactone hydrolase